MTAENPESPEELLEAIRLSTARTLTHVGAYEARQTLHEAKRVSGMARRLGRIEESAKALAAAGIAHYWQLEMVESVMRALDAVRRSANEEDLSRAWFVASLAFLAVDARDVAGIAAGRALDHATRCADAALLARAHSAAGFVASESGDHERAVACLRASAKLLRRHEDRALYMKTICNLARTIHASGDARAEAGNAVAARRSWRHALRLLAHALRVPAPAGDVVIAKGRMGQLLLLLDQPDRAIVVLQESIRRLELESVPWIAAECFLSLAQARLEAGDLKNAAAELEVAASICRDPRAAQSRETSHQLNARLAGELGRTDKEALFGAYARTAKLHRDAEIASARRQALALWQRLEAGTYVGSPAA